MDYCIKCDTQMIHKEHYDICPKCGFSNPDEETLKNESDQNALESQSSEE
jgi:DNA-directed RNA polymerase subunit M/transcription elongation factor TFIIS